MLELYTRNENQPMEEPSIHIPVMLQEVIENLKLQPNSLFVDCTLGLAQHSLQIADSIAPAGHLIGIDRDQSSLERAREALKDKPIKCSLVHEDYRNIDKILDELCIKKVDAILFDLGISSFQLNDPDRGFSFQNDGPLDMRMDQFSYISAFDLINSLSERELSNILESFGQERWHKRIARFIIDQRAKKPIESTSELSEIVRRAIPARFRRQKIHPATRTFQAIRIAVNRELEAIDVAMDKCIERLNEGGRICVIAFHSLEDRIIKEKFRNCAREGKLKLITKKPMRPTEAETQTNPRSRSARLRVAERVKE